MTFCGRKRGRKMDVIKIKDLEIYCHHGVLKEENALGQKFLVSLAMYMDTKKAGDTDELPYSVDYAEVSHFVKKHMEERNFQLIEAVAEHIATQVLCHFSLVRRIKVEIKKPWAPILLPLDTVSVMIEREWSQVCLSVGSNMGDRESHISQALQALERENTIRNMQVADCIETEPYGYTDQASFLNTAVVFETIETPESLLRILQRIEKEGKRERKIHWGPRTIDLDIVLFGNKIVRTENLTIPHKEMHLREFVLEPLLQIAPWALHPVYNKTVSELREEIRGNG